MSQRTVDSKYTQGSFDIAGKWIIENVEELFKYDTVKLDRTFLYKIDDRTDDAGSSLFVAQGQRRVGRRPAYLGDFVGIFDICIYVFIRLFAFFYTYICLCNGLVRFMCCFV